MKKTEESILQKRFNELDLRVVHNKEYDLLAIYPRDCRKGYCVEYEGIKTKEDIIKCVNEYMEDYLKNPNMTSKTVTKNIRKGRKI